MRRVIDPAELIRIYRDAEKEALCALDTARPLSAADLRWPAVHLYALECVQNAILRSNP